MMDVLLIIGSFMGLVMWFVLGVRLFLSSQEKEEQKIRAFLRRMENYGK